MPEKNNVIRLLESRHIEFNTYELSPEKHSAQETARLLQVDPLLVYKTIVVLRTKPGKPILAVIPAPFEVDLKKLARAVDEKKLQLPTEKEAEITTGLLAGGISPLALVNKGFQVVVDINTQNQEKIHISGGQRGLNIKLPTKDLVEITNARIAEITEVPNTSTL